VRGEQETEFIASLVAQIEAQDDVVLSDPTKQAPWHVAYSEGLRWVLRLLEKPVSAPVRAEAAKTERCPKCLTAMDFEPEAGAWRCVERGKHRDEVASPVREA
jgi:hypothetical protein